VKKAILLITIYLLSHSLILAQWVKEYGETDIDESSNDIIALEDGYGIVGRKANDMWFLRMDLNGDTLWTKIFGHEYHYTTPNNLIQNKNEGYFIIASDERTGWLYKNDLNGEIIWEKEYSENWLIRQSIDNSFFVINSAESDTLEILKISEEGDTSWSNQYNIEHYPYGIRSINLYQSKDSTSLISISPFSNNPDRNLEIFKIDKNGDQLWSNIFPDIFPYSCSMNQASSGDYFLTGSTERENYGLDGRSYLIKTDFNGNLLQEEFFNEYYYSQHFTSDNGFIKTSSFGSSIRKTDEEHNLIWEKDFASLLNPYYSFQFKCETEERGYVFINKNDELGPFLFSIDSVGNPGWQISLLEDSVSYPIVTPVIHLGHDEFILAGTKGSYSSNILIKKFYSPKKVELSFFPNSDEIYSDSLNVQIISNIFDSNIYYTLDGSKPDAQSDLYAEAVRIDSNTTIKAIGISTNFENSEVTAAEYKFNQRFDVELNDYYIGVDTNFIGSAVVEIEITIPETELGEVVSLKWMFNDNAIGEGTNLLFDFPTGTNRLILETTGSWGNVQYDTTEVTVYSSKYSVDISHNDFSINKNIVPISQRRSGEFIIPNMHITPYENQTIVTDSTLIFDEGNYFYKVDYFFPTMCIIDSTNVLSVANKTVLLFSDTLSGNYFIKQVGERTGERDLTSPSYSSDSLVSVGTNSGKIYAWNLSNLKENVWVYECGDTIKTDAIITEKSDFIYGCSDNSLYSISSSGELNWKFSIDSNIESTPALGADSTIVFGTDNGYLYKITNDGEELWKFQTDGGIKSSPVIDYYGNIYFGSSDGNFYALNSDGELNWKYESESNKECYASIGRSGLIYANVETNIMYAFNKEGEIKWYFKFFADKTSDISGTPIFEELIHSPLVTDNNLIMIRTSFDKTFIMKENSEYISTPKELPQWPTFKGSNKRTGTRQVDPITSIVNTVHNVPIKYSLSQNYPNPFNPSTTLSYSIPEHGQVELKVYDVLGREVTTLVNKQQQAGSYDVQFNASSLTSGIYFYQLKVGSFVESKKMILIR